MLSRIGFGCASLMRLATARQRRNLLAAALGSGLTHFDVARMYGLGAVEGEVGPFLRKRPEVTTIATKFGIEPSETLQRLSRFQGPARAILNRAPRMRAAVRRRRSAFHEPRRYDAMRGRKSLDKSLSELKLDYVDILFIHDPHPTDDVRRDELIPFLEQARAAGKIRSWGVSQDAFSGFELARELGPRAVLQQRHDALDRKAPPSAAIAFGVLREAHDDIAEWLRDDPARHQAWRDELDTDPLSDGVLASLLLSQVLSESPSRAALYSTTKLHRLEVPARLLRSPLPAHQVQRFGELVAGHRREIRAQTT